MTEINYKDIDKYVNDLSIKNLASIYLIYGEEFIYKNILKKIVGRVFPDALKSLNYEYIDGSVETNFYDALTRLNTYSMFSDTKIIALCDSKIFSSKDKDYTEVLLEALEKGFAEGNHLIITTDSADKRKKLFKKIDECGVMIDCHIPKGSGAADRQNQAAALNERRIEIEKESGKKIENSAYALLCSLIGFDLSIFSDNMEKLINFTGKRKNITTIDVEQIVKRTKQDPIFELTGAILDKNLKNAFFYIDSLISSDFHPLQILIAVINQIRKLLVIKSFIKDKKPSKWQPGLNFNIFKSSVMKDVVDYDKETSDTLKKFGKDSSASLLIAKNNPYAVYQLFLKSENFTENELISSLKLLLNADILLKSSGQNPRIILEKTISDIIGSYFY